jgi:hypothetical protein
MSHIHTCVCVCVHGPADDPNFIAYDRRVIYSALDVRPHPRGLRRRRARGTYHGGWRVDARPIFQLSRSFNGRGGAAPDESVRCISIRSTRNKASAPCADSFVSISIQRLAVAIVPAYNADNWCRIQRCKYGPGLRWAFDSLKVRAHLVRFDFEFVTMR